MMSLFTALHRWSLSQSSEPFLPWVEECREQSLSHRRI
ncbi:hypothetical protein E2C01_096518 [Portunus trituberculatus]|uniref:Uncharacterized protein n=1 Tax=Portunus trituberculatus TaxID=210409 RepID=A0A5B7K718_PORTR|nr:hypothetical protein [Portunus trituberculatus]